MNFQDMILTLHRFWADQNCIIMNPYDVEKGAGTFNPMTFLRSIGPEPGTSPTWSLRGGRPTAATAKIRTDCISITNTRSS